MTKGGILALAPGGISATYATGPKFWLILYLRNDIWHWSIRNINRNGPAFILNLGWSRFTSPHVIWYVNSTACVYHHTTRHNVTRFTVCFLSTLVAGFPDITFKSESYTDIIWDNIQVALITADSYRRHSQERNYIKRAQTVLCANCAAGGRVQNSSVQRAVCITTAMFPV